MQEWEIRCPFCGERFTALIDASVDHQSYVEDCFVCCRPIQITASCEEGEVRDVSAERSA